MARTELWLGTREDGGECVAEIEGITLGNNPAFLVRAESNLPDCIIYLSPDSLGAFDRLVAIGRRMAAWCIYYDGSPIGDRRQHFAARARPCRTETGHPAIRMTNMITFDS